LSELKEDINDIDDLLGKYLAGEASEREQAQAEEWIALNEANRAYFNQLRLIFERASAVKETQAFDADKAWANVQSKISKPKGKTVAFPQFQMATRVAALLIVTMGFGYLAYQWLKTPDQTASLVANTSVLRDSLPDGTLAVLNKGTKIQYTSTRKQRKVELEGEAFFDIKHHENKPFIIETGGLIIEDIGTAFNVKSLSENPLIEVYVESGEVSMRTSTTERFNLVAGEVGVFDKRNQLFSRIQKIDTNRLAYKTGVFNFRDATLETIIHDLNSVFDIKIKLDNDALRNCRLTVIFKNERIEDIVQIIAETLNLTVRKEGNDFALDGVGCTN
jgi:ferric-dicitrate binding protein FerR (iron transport regulator)